jgi:hypothetical protein
MSHPDVFVSLHLHKALESLMDEFNVGRAGPSGLRANAIAHIRIALLLLAKSEHSPPSIGNLTVPEQAG